MFCEKCGTKLENDAVFCSSCGTRVAEIRQEQVVDSGTQQFGGSQIGNVADSVTQQFDGSQYGNTINNGTQQFSGAQAVSQPGYQVTNQAVNQQNYQAGYQGGYQQGNQPGYQTVNQAANQPGYQPSYQQGYQPGYQTNYPGNSTYGGYVAPQKKKNKALIPIIAGIAAVLVIVVLIFALSSGGSGYTQPLDHVMKGIQTGNFNEFKKAFPPFMTDLMSQGNFDMSGSFAVSQGLLKSQYGNNFKVSYKVIDVEKMDQDDFEDMEDSVMSSFNKKIDITDGYKLSCELSIKGNKGEDTTSDTIKVYKIGSKWYVLDDIF